MRTVTVRELKSNPSEALRDAREGPVLVLSRGLPEAVIVSVANDTAAADLAGRVGEAAEVVRGLRERRGARAVRAVDRASRLVAEGRASYGRTDQVALANLAASVSAIVAPRRISLLPPAGEGPALRVVVDVEREPSRGETARITQMAASLGAEVRIRAGRPPGEPPEADEEIVFDRVDVPISILEQMIADGRAHPPTLSGPFPMPTTQAAPGRSASEEIIREREESPW
jgi:prevent-host-death family protein